MAHEGPAITRSAGIGARLRRCQAAARRGLLTPALSGLLLVAVIVLAPPARAETAIGIVGPVTGPLASLGEQVLAGARQAVDDLNAAGGVLGEKLILRIGDDQCDPKQAVAVANRMAGDGVVFVVGHVCSDATIAAAKVYEEEGVVMITPTATNPKLTDEGGEVIFRVAGRDDQQGAVLGAFLARRFAGKRVAFVHDKTAYGRGLAQATRQAMAAAGLDDVLFEAYTAGEKDFSALVSKLKNARIDALFVGGYHGEAGLILRQMRDQGLAARLIGGDALVVDEYWAITGEAGEGTLFSFPPDVRQLEGASELIARFEARGIEPSGYVLYTYAAVQAWAQAAKATGGVQPRTIAKALGALEADTVIGKFSFDAKGDVKRTPYAIYRWRMGADGKGRFEEIGDDD